LILIYKTDVRFGQSASPLLTFELPGYFLSNAAEGLGGDSEVGGKVLEGDSLKKIVVIDQHLPVAVFGGFGLYLLENGFRIKLNLLYQLSDECIPTSEREEFIGILKRHFPNNRFFNGLNVFASRQLCCKAHLGREAIGCFCEKLGDLISVFGNIEAHESFFQEVQMPANTTFFQQDFIPT